MPNRLSLFSIKMLVYFVVVVTFLHCIHTYYTQIGEHSLTSSYTHKYEHPSSFCSSVDLFHVTYYSDRCGKQCVHTLFRYILVYWILFANQYTHTHMCIYLVYKNMINDCDFANISTLAAQTSRPVRFVRPVGSGYIDCNEMWPVMMLDNGRYHRSRHCWHLECKLCHFL